MISTPSYDREQTLDKYLYLPANKESIESLISKLGSLLNESYHKSPVLLTTYPKLFDQFLKRVFHIHNRFYLYRATLRKIALLRHFILFYLGELRSNLCYA